MAEPKRKKKADSAPGPTPPKYTPTPNPNRKYDKPAVDKSFEALKTYNWGDDYDAVLAIDDAVVATHGDDAARKELETRLVAVLATGASRPAKDFTCRMLSVIGTVDAIPALAALLTDKDLAHMGRFALERIMGRESNMAMRNALPEASGTLKLGIIESLGARRVRGSVDALAALAGDADKSAASAAINALGKIGTPKSAQALGDIVSTAPDELKLIAADAALACAERLTVAGQKTEAIALYKGLSSGAQPKHVRLAATRGLLAAAATSE